MTSTALSGWRQRALWSRWASRFVIIYFDTVAKWQRGRFWRNWTKVYQRKQDPGRPRVGAEIRCLLRTVARVGRGAPRIHGELLKLGFNLSENTVSRHMPRRPVGPDTVEFWMAFSCNHKDGNAATDLFTEPTVSLRLLYVLFAIEHGRRHIVYFNVTPNPTSAWVIQQVREAFP